MSGHIPEETIERIRQQIDIVDVIAAYLPLKKAGANFKTNCPFHHEKTPSFHVSASKQIFHCFGCHAGGNVFNFLMRHEQLTFPEAVELLADKLGIKIEQEKDGTRQGAGLWRKRYLAMYQIALGVYRQAVTDAKKGYSASAYLAGRGITQDTAAFFKLGFAEEAWEIVLNACRKEGFEDKEIVDAGLAITGQKGKPFDRFRKRIMFPIYDSRDQVVAFGGRVLDETLPKYMNSPESEFYNKSRILYGLNFAKPHILREDKIVILEGYMDLISLFQAGIKNVAAPLGTALTVDHIRLFKRLTNNAVIVFDADKAGVEAMMRSSDLMVTEEVNVGVVRLPSGDDPDTFVRKNGPGEFEELIRQAQSVFDFRLGYFINKYGGGNVESRARIANEMMSFLAKIPNAVLKGAYMKRLSEKLELPEESIYRGMEDLTHTSGRGHRQGRFVETPLEVKIPKPKAELLMLGLILDDPEKIAVAMDAIEVDWITDTGISRIVRHIFGLHKQGLEVAASKIIIDLMDEKIAEIISESVSAASVMDERGRAFGDCLKKIKEVRLRKERELLQEKLKVGEKNGSSEGLVDIVREISKYDRLIKNL